MIVDHKYMALAFRDYLVLAESMEDKMVFYFLSMLIEHCLIEMKKQHQDFRGGRSQQR